MLITGGEREIKKEKRERERGSEERDERRKRNRNQVNTRNKHYTCTLYQEYTNIYRQGTLNKQHFKNKNSINHANEPERAGLHAQ